jgi:hypothetical protein
VSLVAQLGRHVGKSERRKGLGLEALVALSEAPRITPQTQKRILSQVGHFLDGCVTEGILGRQRFDGTQASYALTIKLRH